MNINAIHTKDRSLLGLAVKCRLISIEKEKEILSVFIEEKDKNQEISIVQVFKENNFLSEEEIEFLLAVKKHLKMKVLDQQFGELGVANKFVNSEKIKAAFNLQNKIFKQTHESKLIGDILVEQNEITRANKTAILLTQDRIEDEYLAEALNEIASNEIERISNNMRFGAIAVKKGFITLDQLNQALNIQKTEEQNSGIKPYLGDILKKHFGLSDKDLATILRIQKELEKQRLSLEKALSLYHQETNIHKQLNKAFEYRFSKNKLEAFIRIKKGLTQEILVTDFIDWLNSIGITFGICDQTTIQTFLDKDQINSEIRIARGDAPMDPENESIEYFFNTDMNTESQEPLPVKKGDILAKIISHQEGRPGKDVCGFNIAPPEYKNIPLACGEGVIKKDTLFIAEIDGDPTLFKNRTLMIIPDNLSCPTKYIDGHITQNLENKYQAVNLEIAGSIEPKGKLVCNDVYVKGDVRGQIRASGSIQIDGNATNSSADPEKFPCILSSDEDIAIHKKILNIIIITSRSLKAPQSDLMYSKVYAFHDITLNNVYSKEGNPALLQIGKNPHLQEKAVHQSIIEKTKELDRLSGKDEFDEIDMQFNTKAQAQNKYLTQHTILQELLNLFDDEKYESLHTLEEKIKKLMGQTRNRSGHEYSELLELNGTKKFINELLNDQAGLSCDKQKKHLTEMLGIKYGMYKASVNATRRYKNECHARKDNILKKISRVQPRIDELTKIIQALSVKKDYMRLKAEKNELAVNPAIRVKSMVEKGTIIKGKETALIIDQNMYGVKFSEKKDKTGKLRIVIEGFYD